MNIPLSSPDVTQHEIDAVVGVLQSRHLALGPKLAEFEARIAAHAGCAHAVAVNSGTSALHLIIRAYGLGPGDEVITTPFSFVASTNCLLYEGARPVFVDIEPASLNLDADLIEQAVTPATKAILAVDVFGRPANWSALREIAGRRGLRLIEDSCEALGARYRWSDGTWSQAGSLGEVGCFAFYPNKQITTGEGGVLVTDDEELARLARSMRNQGRDEGAGWLQHARLGFNYRLSDLNCALGIAQMDRLEEILTARAQVASWYAEELAEIEALRPPSPSADVEVSWFVYVVRLAAEYTREQRDRLLDFLRAEGIGCSNYFSPLHLQPYMSAQFGYRPGDYPVTESVADRTIALPFFNRLSREQVATVGETLRRGIEFLS